MPQTSASLLERLRDRGDSDAWTRIWDRFHDEHVARTLLAWGEPEFEPKTWQAFRRQALDAASPTTVAAELGMSVNAVLIAKSRILKRLRELGQGLIDQDPVR